MYVKDATYFHIHRAFNIEFSRLWNVGNKIDFKKEVLNQFNAHYDNFNPSMSVNNVDYPFIEGVKILEKGVDLTRENFSYILQKLTLISEEFALYQRETVFEEVRCSSYPDLPSRKSCIWVCEEAALDFWYKTLVDSNTKIFQVALSGIIYEADQKYLHREILPVKTLRENAHNYWGGTSGINALEKEILFEGTVSIINEIDPASLTHRAVAP